MAKCEEIREQISYAGNRHSAESMQFIGTPISLVKLHGRSFVNYKFFGYN